MLPFYSVPEPGIRTQSRPLLKSASVTAGICIYASTVLPFVQNDTITLTDANDIIRIPEAAFGDPDTAATARERLHSLKQGKKDFASYYAEFQMHAAKLHWGEHSKMDVFREGLSIDRHERLISTPDSTTFTEVCCDLPAVGFQDPGLPGQTGTPLGPRPSNPTCSPCADPSTGFGSPFHQRHRPPARTHGPLCQPRKDFRRRKGCQTSRRTLPVLRRNGTYGK